MKRARVKVVLLALLLLPVVSVIGLTRASSPAAAQSRPVLYLTFDDGPGPFTSQYLDLLGHYRIKATFFVTGRATSANQNLARRIVAEGHAIGNHSYDHSQLTALSDEAIRSEFMSTNQAVATATDTVPVCYRPPYGSVNGRVHQVAIQAGLPNREWTTGSLDNHWGLWDIDTNDWRLSQSSTSWTEADMRRQLDKARDGDTVLMHDGGLNRARGLSVLSQWLAANHDRFEFRVLPGCGGTVAEPLLDPARPELWHRFQIARLYRAYFDRAPDLAGWTYWNEQFARGASLMQISHWFSESSEFANLGQRSDGEFTTFVYQQVLDREPDVDGFAYWTAALHRGLDRGELVILFSESEEYLRRSAPIMTGECYTGDVRSSYLCWASQLPPAQTW